MADQRLNPETEASIIDSIGDMGEQELGRFLDTGAQALGTHIDTMGLSIEYGIKEQLELSKATLLNDAGSRTDQPAHCKP